MPDGDTSVANNTVQPDPSDADLLKIFLVIAEDWELTNAQKSALLRISVSTFRRWRQRLPKLTADQRLCISYLLNIYLDLFAIVDDHEEEANTWVTSPNGEYGGRTPLEVMISGTLVDVYRVYTYVHSIAV
jgi:uncharacterized protein (DUF2384 family)